MEFRIKHSTNFNILDTTKDNMLNTVYGKEPSLFKLGVNNIKESLLILIPLLRPQIVFLIFFFQLFLEVYLFSSINLLNIY